jgi:hypothetical protein
VNASVQQAALNNASWCDAVCSAHQAPGCFDAGLWWNSGPVPRFHPNAVTLEGEPAHLHERLAALAGAHDGASWSVKDSFACVDLGALGCRELFSAHWLWRAPLVGGARPGGLRRQLVADALELAEWEHAWAGGGPPKAERIFLPALLDDPSTAVIGFERAERIVAGLTAHRAGGVVGLTNLFVPADEPDRYREACVHAAATLFPGLPLVSYELDAEAPAFMRLGFETIGALRVWVREPPRTPE